MREIKFKAFHKLTGKLFGVYSFTDKEVFEHSFDGIYTSPTLPAKREDCELMQFTGAGLYLPFDKNNIRVDIYEGDIIEWFDCSELKLGEVCWCDCTYQFWVRDKEKKDLNLYHYLSEFCLIRVAGNIYQNPELFTK